MKQLRIPMLESPEMVDDTLPWHARAGILVEEYGFQPTTISEINTAFSGVIAFDEAPAKAGKHLQEVLLHQKSNPIVDSPQRAVRAIVQAMGHYYRDAASRRDGLRSVYDTLLQDVNPNLPLLEIKELDALGILSGIQHYSVRDGIVGQKRDKLQGGIKEFDGEHRLVTGYDVSSNNLLNEVVIEMLLKTLPEDSQTTGGFAALALDAGKSQRNRREWWRNGLVQSRSHLAARPVVDNILKTSGVVI